MPANRIGIRIELLPHGEGLPLPWYATSGSSGCDLYAAVPENEPIFLRAYGGFEFIPCGFKAALPRGIEAQIRPRSGLARRHGVTVLNSPGTIDSDYRGEWGVLLINHGPLPVEIARGLRIAQAVFAPVLSVAPRTSDKPLDATERGEGGFGSTGT